MTRLTVSARVAAARELLQGSPRSEYATLPPECQADLQEAVEFLHSAEDRLDGEESE